MNKFEVYAKFKEEMTVCNKDLLWLTIPHCKEKAIEQHDVGILRVMLNLDWVGTWYDNVVSQERQGHKVLPDYFWDEAVKELERWAVKLCRRGLHLPPYYDDLSASIKKLRKSIKVRSEELKTLNKDSVEWQKISKSLTRTKKKMKKLLQKAREIMSNCNHLIDCEVFYDTYFHGQCPKTFEALYAARRDVATQIRLYAKMLKEA